MEAGCQSAAEDKGEASRVGGEKCRQAGRQAGIQLL